MQEFKAAEFNRTTGPRTVRGRWRLAGVRSSFLPLRVGLRSDCTYASLFSAAHLSEQSMPCAASSRTTSRWPAAAAQFAPSAVRWIPFARRSRNAALLCAWRLSTRIVNAFLFG